MILYSLALIYAFALILAANQALRAREARWLTALLSLGLAQADSLWRRVAWLIARLSPGERPRFDWRSPVHRVGGLLALALLSWSLWRMLALNADGGATYFAGDRAGILANLAAATLINVALASIGVGWGIRRRGSSVCSRLGLRWPTLGDWLAGLCMGALIYVAATLAATMLPSSASADYVGARALFDEIKGSMAAALLLAILSGAGEEILFRGALQPVFGILLSSILFTFTHAHYGFSPQLMLLFFVSVGFGLARRRVSTTAAIITHASYNFAPFLLFSLSHAK